jgi:MFS family permease
MDQTVTEATTDDASLTASHRILGLVHGRRPLLILYIVVALLFWMCLYLYAPTLPTYAQTKTGSLASVGIILAQYGLWQAIIRLPVGIAADWLGRRKPFIFGGLALAGLGAWIMGSSDTAWGLGIGRAVTGLGAATWVPLITVFSSLFRAQDAVTATALLSAVGSVGRVAATGVTGSLNNLGGYSLAFYLAAGLALLAALLVVPAREKVYAPRKPSVEGIGKVITRRDVLLPSLLAAVVQYYIWAVTFSFMPILANSLGATDVTQSMLMSLHVGLVALGSFSAAAVVRRVGALRLVYATFLLLAAGTALTALAPSLAAVFLAQFLLGVGRGLGYPVLMGLSIRDVADAQRTTAMGLHQSVYSIGMFAGPWLSGLMADAMGIRPMLGLTAAVCLAAALVLIHLLPVNQANHR